MVDLVAVQAAVEQFDVLRLAAHDVDQREALHVEVLQVFDFFAEQHGRRCAVAKEQRELAARFGRQRGLHQREHRRDAAAHREGHVMALVLGREIHGEVAGGRHHFQRLARLQFVVGPTGERAFVDLLDGHAQQLVVRGGTDRVRAAQLFAIQLRAQGQVLPRQEGELVGQRVGQVKGDDHGIARIARHRGHLQGMKLVAHLETALSES
ncbi:hypothetical protein D3C71_1413810 [compost metagenome]